MADVINFPSSTDSLVTEREQTHGPYEITATCSQQLKCYLRAFDNWGKLSMEMRESLDNMCCKIGRIMSGNHSHIDHWNDIAGYAKLVSRTLTTKPTEG